MRWRPSVTGTRPGVSIFTGSMVFGDSPYIRPGNGGFGDPGCLWPEAAEKAVVCLLSQGKRVEAVKDRAGTPDQDRYTGKRIAFIVPVSSIGGAKQFEFLTDGRGFVKGGEHVEGYKV